MELHNSHRRAPPSIKRITESAEAFDFNTNLQFKYWARSTKALFQEAEFCAQEGDYRRAYYYLYRHSLLVLQYLPTHPEFSDPENKVLFKALQRGLPKALRLLEQFKPIIENEYSEWKRQSSVDKEPDNSTYVAGELASALVDVKVLNAAQNQDLAVQLARRVQERRDAEIRPQIHNRNQDWIVWPLQRPDTAETLEDDELRHRIEETRRQLDRSTKGSSSPSYLERPTSPSSPSSSGHYVYPSFSPSRPVSYQYNTPTPPSNNAPPPIPRKELPASSPSLQLLAELKGPARPPKNAIEPPESLPKLLPKTSASPEPTPDDPFIFGPGAYLESGEPLRTIFLPAGLKHEFVRIAEKNTRAEIETCGMLCGAPQNNVLYIHELLIPEQIGTSDTCETVNELAIHEYLEKVKLNCYGWIHTHPTQTCFMSSRDLHTHASYQAGLPEAIAVVCAPKFKPSFGIFRLTDPPGKGHILNCRQSATFHTHSISNIYTQCKEPTGHVIERDDLRFKVTDLRPRK